MGYNKAISALKNHPKEITTWEVCATADMCMLHCVRARFVQWVYTSLGCCILRPQEGFQCITSSWYTGIPVSKYLFLCNAL